MTTPVNGVCAVSVKARGHWYPVSTEGLTYAHTADEVGGCESASFTITDTKLRGLLAADSQVVISSRRTSRVVWSGTAENVDPTDDGTGLQVTCQGSKYLLADRRFTLPYLVTRLDAWEMDNLHASVLGGEVSTGPLPWAPALIPNAVLLSLPGMVTLFEGDRTRARCTAFEDSDMKVGGIYGLNISGIDSDELQSAIYVGDAGFGNVPYQRNLRDASWVTNAWAGSSGEFPYDQDKISLEIRLEEVITNAPNTFLALPYDRMTTWYGLRVYGQMKDRFGSNIVTATGTPGLDPVLVVEDLIGRCLSDVISTDQARSPRYALYGTTPRYWPETLDYSDAPVTPLQVISDLLSFNPDFFCMVSPIDLTDEALGNPAHGLTFAPWPTRPRHNIAQGDVRWETSGDDALYNRVTITWVDASGRTRSKTYVADLNVYQDLIHMGSRIRELEPVDLGSQIGSQGNADRIAAVIFDSYARLPKGGTVFVDKPLANLMSGQMTPPEHLTPGALAHVAETGENLRCTAVSVDSDNGTATLTLSNPRLDIPELVARATRRKRR